MRLHKQFDPENLYLKQAIRTTIVALAALLVGTLFDFNRSTFLVWSSIFILQVAIGITLKEQIISIAWASLLGLIGVVAITAVAGFRLPTALVMTLFCAVASLLNAWGTSAWAVGFHASLLTFLAFSTSSGSTALVFDRALQIALGTLLALLATLLIWPAIPKRLYWKSLSSTLRASCFFYDAAVSVMADRTSSRALRCFRRRRDEAFSLLHRNREIAAAWHSKPVAIKTAQLGDELDKLHSSIIAISLLQRCSVADLDLKRLEEIGLNLRGALDFSTSKRLESLATIASLIEELEHKRESECDFLVHYLRLLQESCHSILTLVPPDE